MGPNDNHLKVEHMQSWIERGGVRAPSSERHRISARRPEDERLHESSQEAKRERGYGGYLKKIRNFSFQGSYLCCPW